MSIIPAGVRVRYVPMQSGPETYRVELIGRNGFLSVGFTALDRKSRRWTSFCRNQPSHRAQKGWLRRRDAASYMVISAGFATASDQRTRVAA